MDKQRKVPWTRLFTGLRHDSDIIRDSTRRLNGDRHYRVKLRLPHRTLPSVRAKLAPYGFTVTTNGSWNHRDRADCIKCIRHQRAS